MRRIPFWDQADLTRLWFISGRGPKANAFWGGDAPGPAAEAPGFPGAVPVACR
jgi:hypothetical protein